MNKFKYLILTIITLLPGLASAQDTGAGLFQTYQMEIILSLAVLVCFIAFLALVVAWFGLRVIVRMRLEEQGVKVDEAFIAAQPGDEHLGSWDRFWNRFNAAVPVASEETIATDHEYDGIRELDNKLPPWWLYGFYFTIIFGVFYLFYYHFGPGMNQDEEFKAQMAEARLAVQANLAGIENLVDESNVTLLTDDADLVSGGNVYKANCAVCHNADGGGGVGPNLTDKYWLHGGDLASIFKTIKYGVSAKGMIAWETQLSATQIQQVSTFIYNLEGTTSAAPKDAQGELFERESQVPEEEAVLSDSTVAVSN
jgi:cytochrome c oxidase cbb3-type subunit 3